MLAFMLVHMVLPLVIKEATTLAYGMTENS